MCDCNKTDPPRETDSYTTQVKQSIESHTVYELKQRLEYHFRMMMDIQKAIDALNSIR